MKSETDETDIIYISFLQQPTVHKHFDMLAATLMQKRPLDNSIASGVQKKTCTATNRGEETTKPWEVLSKTYKVMELTSLRNRAQCAASKQAARAATMEFNDQIDFLKRQVVTLENRNRAIVQQNHDHNEHVKLAMDDLGESLSNLESYIPFHQGVTANIRAARKACEAALRAQTYALKAKAAATQAEQEEAWASIEASNALLKAASSAEVTSLRAANASLKAANASLKAVNASLKAANTSLKVANASFEAGGEVGYEADISSEEDDEPYVINLTNDGDEDEEKKEDITWTLDNEDDKEDITRGKDSDYTP